MEGGTIGTSEHTPEYEKKETKRLENNIVETTLGLMIKIFQKTCLKWQFVKLLFVYKCDGTFNKAKEKQQKCYITMILC